MKKKLVAGFATGLFFLGVIGMANATPIIFDDQSAFLSSTGATSATGTLPYLDYAGTSVTLGDITLTSSQGIYVGYSGYDWTERITGNDIAINDIENLDISINLTSSVFSFGFEFVEPEFDPHVTAPFVDSTFGVTLMNGTTIVDSFTFNAPNDQAYFVGVWTDVGFDNVEIREISGGIENEFFGQFYTGNAPAPAPVPEPATMLLFSTGLAGIVGNRIRRKKK